MGLGFSPLPCFPLCTCIIAHIWLLVKYFFEKSQFYFLGFRLHPLLSGSVLLAKSLVEELGNTPWNRTFGEISFRTLLLCAFIITQLTRFVKGFFQLFFRASSVGFEPLGSVASLQPRWDSPLDNDSIPHLGEFVKCFGKIIFFIFFRIFLLTNSERCDIMEISRASSESARLEKIKSAPDGKGHHRGQEAYRI